MNQWYFGGSGTCNDTFELGENRLAGGGVGSRKAWKLVRITQHEVGMDCDRLDFETRADRCNLFGVCLRVTERRWIDVSQSFEHCQFRVSEAKLLDLLERLIPFEIGEREG